MSDISLDAIEQLESVLDAKSGGGPNGSATGRVTRVDADGTAWVHVFGGEGETPLRAYGSAVQPGDVIGVEQRGNGLYASGNWSRPSTDDEAANAAQRTADAASSTASRAATASQSAKRAADEAAEVANAVNQHFFDDSDGIHVTEADRDTWTQQHSGKNILINSLGILLRNALNNLVSITASAIAFFDGSGNSASNVVAQFGGSGAQIGKSGAAHMEVVSDAIRGVNEDGMPYFEVANAGGKTARNVTAMLSPQKTVTIPTSNPSGYSNWMLLGSFDGSRISPDVSTVTISAAATKIRSLVSNVSVSPTGTSANTYTVTVGTANTWTVEQAVTLNYSGSPTLSISGSKLYIKYVYTSGNVYEVYWRFTYASGAEVAQYNLEVTVDLGMSSLLYQVDSYGSAFSFGSSAGNRGVFSSSLGENIVASFDNQTAIGRYNDNQSTNAFEIGNGTSDNARSNAFAVDWNGYIYPCDEKMPDWVVAQGTSGIWTYRKWHSGIAECWGTYSASIAITSSSASYGGYRSNLITATAYPSGTFSATPTVTATSMSSGGNWVTNTSSSDKNNAKFYLSCGTSSAASTRDIAIHAIGKWK